jgi:diketogulonate reductase-like aldo/keto reductase
VDGSTKPEALAAATASALKVGYRHFDSAEMYSTMPSVRKAIAESKIDRKELWITSKLKGLPIGKFEDVSKRVRGMPALKSVIPARIIP